MQQIKFIQAVSLDGIKIIELITFEQLMKNSRLLEGYLFMNYSSLLKVRFIMLLDS